MGLRKVLCFHGFGQTADLFTMPVMKLTKQLPEFQFEVMEGSHHLTKSTEFDIISDSAEGVGSELANLGREGVLQLCGYWPLALTKKRDARGNLITNPSSAHFIDRAVKQAFAAIEACGGVEGLVGFSQGGELAYTLLERWSQAPAAVRKQLKWVATFGSEDLHADAVEPPAMEAIPAGIRLFLCCGNQRDKKGFLDPTGVQAVSTLAARFSAAQVPCCELMWDGGHQLPDGLHAASVYGQLRDFINCKESQLPAAAAVRDASDTAAVERSSLEQPAEAEAEALPANDSDVASAVNQKISEAQITLQSLGHQVEQLILAGECSVAVASAVDGLAPDARVGLLQGALRKIKTELKNRNSKTIKADQLVLEWMMQRLKHKLG